MVGAGRGWLRVGPDPRIAAWAAAALPVARRAVEQSDEEWRCGGTWFVGVEALPNGPCGRMGDTDFPWPALPLPPAPLHRGQLSVTRPGYPQPWPGEDDAGYRFRRNRDAAHLDGLLPVGPARRRMVREPHAWILGLPLTQCEAGAAPLVVWEGSHRLMRVALERAFAGHDPAAWGEVDLTDAYKAARAEVFRQCRRVELPGRPGEAVVLHRHLIHGVAPWATGAHAPPEGRMVAYFRPLLPSVADWIAAD
ncbi:MAG: hypothetical protein R3D63_13740 [Paracoccaceae bacterium]